MIERLLDDNIELVVRPVDNARVCADAGQITQVVTNLVLNAREAMPHGGTLTVSVDLATVDGAPFVKLSVRDTGVGMDAETRRRLFEPFFTTRPRGHGVGLGLASVFGIVQQCGGTIDVRSAPGEGATFEILLPRITDGEVEAPAPAVEAGRNGAETVLVVDDQQAVRLAVRDTLERVGYHVLVASNAGEALLLCERHDRPIHLLLSDVVMPHVSGPELAKRLAPLRPEMKVLLMSGHTDGHAGVGAYAYIQKPLVPEVLAARIGDLLR
jgi:CheY-like chemotaxis protein